MLRILENFLGSLGIVCQNHKRCLYAEECVEKTCASNFFPLQVQSLPVYPRLPSSHHHAKISANVSRGRDSTYKIVLVSKIVNKSPF